MINSENLYNRLNSSLTPFVFTVHPATTAGATTTFTDFSAVQTATVNVQETHEIRARDAQGNLKQDQLDVFDIKLTHKFDPSTVVTATVAPTADATYRVTYTLAKQGAYTLTALVQPGGSGSFAHLAESQTTVTCFVTDAAPENTDIAGEGITQATAGVV